MTGRGGKGARFRRNQQRSGVQYGAIPPAAPVPAGPRPCSERFTGCGHACHCGVSWDTGEDRPPCPYGGSY